MKSSNYKRFSNRPKWLMMLYLVLVTAVSSCMLFSEVKPVEELNESMECKFHSVDVALDGGSIVLSVEKPSGGLIHLMLLNKLLQKKYGRVAIDEHVFWSSDDRRFKEHSIIQKGTESESRWVRMITSAKENCNDETSSRILEQFAKLLMDRKTESKMLHEAVSKYYDENRKRQE